MGALVLNPGVAPAFQDGKEQTLLADDRELQQVVR
jgi:hypothetical protein